MKFLIAIAALGLLTSAQSLDRNIVTLIPSTNPSTGASVTPGQLLMRDIVEPARTVGITGPAAVTQLVVVSATAASPMVLTLNALAPAWLVTGATITLSGATGSGCSGMNATLPVFSATGSTVTVTYNNTACTYGASSASMLTHFLWVFMPGDAIGPVCSDGHQNLTVNPSCAGAGGGLPVPDSTIITQGAADATKQMRFSNTGITTGNTRVLSVQDFNYTLAGIDHTETFTAAQTFSANILASGTPNIGSTTNAFNSIYGAFVQTQYIQFVDGSFPLSHWQMAMDASTDPNLSLTDGINIYWTQVLGWPGATWNFFESLVPGTTDTVNLGSSTSEWLNLYVHNIVCTGSCGAGLPVADSTIITDNAADPTKKMRFDDSIITTGNTRVLQVQDANYTLAGINLAETFTAAQTFNSGTMLGTTTTDVGSSTNYFRTGNFGTSVISPIVRVIQGTPSAYGSYFDFSALASYFRMKDSSSNILLQIDETGGYANSFWEFEGSIVNTGGTSALGTSGLPWATANINTLTLNTGLAGTYSLSGDETVTGNWYNRTFSGAPSCSGISNGWQGVDTSGLNLDLCVSSTLYSVPLVSSGAWTTYTPSGTNLSSPTWDAAYQCVGKTCSVRIGVAATATSTGTIAVSLPVAPFDTNQAPSCFIITSGTYSVQPCVISGSTIVNEGNWTGGSAHTWIFSMVYQST